MTARRDVDKDKNYAFYNMNSDINMIEVKGHWDPNYKDNRKKSETELSDDDRFIWQFTKTEVDLNSRKADTEDWIKTGSIFLYEGEI